jgi:hypothetical protein
MQNRAAGYTRGIVEDNFPALSELLVLALNSVL